MNSKLINLFSRIKLNILNKPLYRGMLTYSITYPTGSFIQQYLNVKQNNQESINYNRIIKFGLFGSLIIAPGVNLWVTYINKIIIGSTTIHSLGKVFLEQIIYAPIFYTVFYFGLTIMDGENIYKAIEEVKTKSVYTYSIGLLVWPFLQLYNYSYVSNKNRLVFMSFFGLIWTVYLSYMKYVVEIKKEQIDQVKENK